MVSYTYPMLHQILQKSPVLLQRYPGKRIPQSVPSMIIWWEISVQLLTWMKLSMALARKFDTTKFRREKSIDQVGHIIFKDLALTLRKCERWVIFRCFQILSTLIEMLMAVYKLFILVLIILTSRLQMKTRAIADWRQRRELSMLCL